ncbi:MAG: hypothetical protein Q7R52_05465 [archaeon]|nr:hypothetical protein [archaeon]
MKRFFLVVLLLLIFPLVSAVEFDVKTNYSLGETMIAKVSGSFTDPITADNVYFYRNNVRIPLIYDVAKINEEFYIYALLPENPGNYSISIKNANYMKSNQISSDEIKKEFSILNSWPDFSVNPGFIITKEDFFIKVQNLRDEKIILQVKEGKEKETATTKSLFSSIFSIKPEEIIEGIEIRSGEIKKINFELNELNSSRFDFITLKTNNTKYEIPIYITANQTVVKQIKEFRFSPDKLDLSLLLNSNKTKIFYIYNTGQLELDNIELIPSSDIKSYISLSTTIIEKLDAGSTFRIDMYISPQKKEKTIEGTILATTEDNEISLPVKLVYSKEEIVKPDDYVPEVVQNCSKLGGKICTKEEKCNGESVDALDAKCCLKECIKSSSLNSNLKWLGLIIILIIIGIAYWFYSSKYSRTRSEVNLLKPKRN